MSGLAALVAGHNPPDIYQWHSAAHVDDVRHCVEHAGWRFYYLDGWILEDKETFLKAVAVAMDLPDDIVRGFDAMAEALGGIDSGDSNGIVLLWDGWSPLARHDPQAFDDAIAAFRARVEKGGFAVILRGEGPPLEFEELPYKH